MARAPRSVKMIFFPMRATLRDLKGREPQYRLLEIKIIPHGDVIGFLEGEEPMDEKVVGLETLVLLDRHRA